MSKLSSKQLVIFSLIVLVAVGFFLRAYQFSPWLHFELDQARDARVIDHALLDGPAELPLLGPKAGGTFLRLAPGFYYVQYVSGLLFGGTPSGIAFLIMLLSASAVLVFFFFIRRYFSVHLSLLLTALFAVSAFFVMYGRFAWNPNMLPFFVLLGMYALLRSVDSGEEKRERWFLVAVCSLTLATHAHFLAFLALPAIALVFLLIKRPRFSLRVWAGALVVVAVLYLPMALNEWETGGSNTREFLAAVTEKSTKEDHGIVEKFLRDTSEHALGALVITTGFEGATFPTFSLDQGKLVRKCAEKCDRGKWYGVAAAMVFGLSLLALVFFFWREEERKKKDFLLLCGIWFAVTFVLFLPLSYGFAPRFFLLSGMLFIILLGLFLLGVKRICGRRVGGTIISLVVGAFIFSNLFFLSQRFDELARAGSEAIDSAPDRILKERIRVTLEQQNRIVDMLEARSREHNFPVYMFSEPQHRRALKYLMEKRGIENAVLGFDGIYRQGVYFLILRAQSDIEDAVKKYRVNYEIGETSSFGTLIVLELIPKEEAIIGERQDFSVPKPSDSKAPPRYTWKEFFMRNGTASTEGDSALEAGEDEAAVREQEKP